MNNEDQASKITPETPLPPSHEDLMRRILAISTVGLMYFTLLAYIITRDVFILGTTTIVGVAVIAVFRYFFSR